jgi:hypothetical protein
MGGRVACAGVGIFCRRARDNGDADVGFDPGPAKEYARQLMRRDYAECIGYIGCECARAAGGPRRHTKQAKPSPCPGDARCARAKDTQPMSKKIFDLNYVELSYWLLGGPRDSTEVC